MNETLSPRDLARTIGVSESSVKRWIDGGQIRAARTAGGHRRITRADAIQFIRQTSASLLTPEALGLDDIATAQSAGVRSLDADRFYDLLVQGAAAEARGALLGAYMDGEALATICDQTIRTALERIGTLWEGHEDGIFLEHRAVAICSQAVHQIRGTLGNLGPRVAIGGAVSNDLYILPTLMAAAVLESIGMKAVNLGPHTPASALRNADQSQPADLFWLSASSVRDAAGISAEIDAFLAYLDDHSDARLILGGRAHPSITSRSERLYRADSLSELAAFAHGIGVANGEDASHDTARKA